MSLLGEIKCCPAQTTATLALSPSILNFVAVKIASLPRYAMGSPHHSTSKGGSPQCEGDTSLSDHVVVLALLLVRHQKLAEVPGRSSAREAVKTEEHIYLHGGQHLLL